MQLRYLNVYFFFALFIGVGVVVFLIFQPFVTAIIAAAILTALTKRPYNAFERLFRGRRVLSALLTCFLSIFAIVLPLFIVATLVIGEVNSLYENIAEGNTLEETVNKSYAAVEASPLLSALIQRENFSEEKIIQDLQHLSSNVLDLIPALYQNITSFILWVFVLFFTLYYFLIDGKRALRYLMRVSPLKDEHDKLLIQKFVSISRAALKGNLIIGIIQGTLGGVSFAIAGVPGAVIWGLLMVLFSLVPMIGTTIIWLPAGLILLAIGSIWQGVFILLFGGLVISSIDNILRPKFVGRDSAMHPLLIFFATLGGIYLFGLPGFVIGPIIVALFLALAEIYAIEFQTQLKEYNQPPKDPAAGIS